MFVRVLGYRKTDDAFVLSTDL